MTVTLRLHVKGLYVYVNNCAAGQRLPGTTLARVGKLVPAPVDPETEDVQCLRDHFHITFPQFALFETSCEGA